jgi:hypothetical protein
MRASAESKDEARYDCDRSSPVGDKVHLVSFELRGPPRTQGMSLADSSYLLRRIQKLPG